MTGETMYVGMSTSKKGIKGAIAEVLRKKPLERGKHIIICFTYQDKMNLKVLTKKETEMIIKYEPKWNLKKNPFYRKMSKKEKEEYKQ